MVASHKDQRLPEKFRCPHNTCLPERELTMAISQINTECPTMSLPGL